MTFDLSTLQVGDTCVLRDGREVEFIYFNAYCKQFPYIFVSKDGSVFMYSTDGRASFYKQGNTSVDIGYRLVEVDVIERKGDV